MDLRNVGMTAWLSEVLKISVRTSVSCSAQSFSARPGMLSGPTALRGLILWSSLRQLETDRAPGRWEVWAVFVHICNSAFQTVNKSGRVHLGGMCFQHQRPVAGAYSQWCSEWLVTGSVCLCCLWSDHWFFEHMTISHFWCHRTDWLLLFRGLLYLLIWKLNLWSLTAHKPLLSSMVSGLHVWRWS